MTMYLNASCIAPDDPVLNPELMRQAGALLSLDELKKGMLCIHCDKVLTKDEKQYLTDTCSNCELEVWEGI